MCSVFSALSVWHRVRWADLFSSVISEHVLGAPLNYLEKGEEISVNASVVRKKMENLVNVLASHHVVDFLTHQIVHECLFH